MNTSEFDGLLRRRFEQHEFAYQPEEWVKVKTELDKIMPERKSRSRPFFFLLLAPGMAASVAAIACAVYFINYTSGVRSKNVLSSYASRTTSRPAHAVRPASEMQQAVSYTLPRHEDAPRTEALPGTEKPATEEAIVAATVTPPAAAAGKILLTNDNALPEASVVLKNKHKTEKRQFERIDFTMFEADEDKQRNGGNTSFSVGGGINYGSMDAGYVVGVNARRNLNSRLYVESDIAMVNNAATQRTETITSQPGSGPGSLGKMTQNAKMTGTLPLSSNDDAGSSTVQRSVESHSTNLYYLQVSPTIGYQLYPELSVGVGPDFQQLLQSDDKKVLYRTNDKAVESLPSFDFGVQAKAEVAVTRKLKAGLQYRKGMNSMLQKESSKDRNYMQFQIKYTMFNK